MRVSYDSSKREKALADRGLDFEDAVAVFDGLTVEVEDTRKDYGEKRIICYGLLAGRMVVIGYTPVARCATFLVCERQMIVNKRASPRTLGSDLARVDAHVVKPVEYKELPELTDDLLSRAVVKKGGRPKSASPRQLISLRLPVDVISKWRATGPGWQTRMAERLARVHVVRARSEI